MDLLLDSHIVLWAVERPHHLKAAAREAIEDRENTIYVSAAVIWELRLKCARGKLKLPDDFESILSESGFSQAPIRWEHGLAAAALPTIHKDLFDRIMVAQSLADQMILVTRDTSILKYPANFLEG